jgi:hypothetical protein
MAEIQSHVLITGGTGFIGEILCRELAETDARVTVLSRHPGRAGAKLPAAVRPIGGLEELDGDDVPVTAIVNLAGEPIADGRWTAEKRRELFDSRIGTTRDLFNYFAGVEHKPEVLVSGSAIGYYGPHGSEVLDESGNANPSLSHDLCAAWEQAALRFEAMGTRVCLLRTGIVLGPNGGALGSLLPLFKWGLGGPIGSGRQWMSWIHRDDLVGMILHCFSRKDLAGPVNGTAPGVVTNRTFARTLAKVLRRPAVMRTPGWVLKLIYGQMAEELLISGQKVYPRKALQARFRFRFPELEPALRDILNRP